MQRRHFLKMTAAGAVYWPLSTCLASLAQAAVPADVPAAMRAQEALGRHADSLATPAGWRRFEVTTQVSLLEDLGGRSARVWLPLPLASAHEYQQLLSLEVASNGQWRLSQDAHYQAGMLNVDWPAQLKQTPQLSVVSQLLTRDRATLPGAAPATLAQPERGFTSTSDAHDLSKPRGLASPQRRSPYIICRASCARSGGRRSSARRPRPRARRSGARSLLNRRTSPSVMPMVAMPLSTITHSWSLLYLAVIGEGS